MSLRYVNKQHSTPTVNYKPKHTPFVQYNIGLFLMLYITGSQNLVF